MDFMDYLPQIIKPLSSSEPCGIDPKYETMYEGIRSEVAKMSGIGHGAPDWIKVENDSFTMLAQESKEINLMAYLASAMTINHDLDGMIAGSNCFSAFLKSFWPNMFPPLNKVVIRARAVSWFNDRVTERKEIFKVKDRPKLEQALQAIKDLKTVVYEYFTEPPTKFSGIQNLIEEQLAVLPQEKPEPVKTEVLPTPDAPPSKTEGQPKPQATPTPQPSQPAPAQVSNETTSLSVKEINFEDLNSLKKTLIPLANDILKADPTLTLSYSLIREAAWLNLKIPKDQNGTTMVPAPVPEIQDSLKAMNSKASWPDLLARCEAMLPRTPFWLDLQYFAYNAAVKQGEPYAEVAMTIEFYARKLATEHADLLKLKFDDGTPFASSAAKNWFKEAVEAGSGGGGKPAPEEEFASALAEKGTNQLSACLEEAEKWIRQAPSRRVQFLFRTEMARFYLEAGQKLWALAILKAQQKEMETYQLESWEPEICGPVWSLVLEILPTLPPDTPQLRDMTDTARIHLATTRMDLTAEHQLGTFK